MSTPSSLDTCPTDASAAECLDRHLRDRGAAVARRELATALTSLDGLSRAERRVVVRMADRIVAGVLAPARAAADPDDAAPASEAVGRLFLPDEGVRDQE
jgi:hypothetical protein